MKYKTLHCLYFPKLSWVNVLYVSRVTVILKKGGTLFCDGVILGVHSGLAPEGEKQGSEKLGF